MRQALLGVFRFIKRCQRSVLKSRVLRTLYLREEIPAAEDRLILLSWHANQLAIIQDWF